MGHLSSLHMADRHLAPRFHLQRFKAQAVVRLVDEVVKEAPAVEVAGHSVLLLLRLAWRAVSALHSADLSVVAQWLQEVHHRHHRRPETAAGHTLTVPAALAVRLALDLSHLEGSHLTIHGM